MSKVTSFEEACKEQGIDPNPEPDISKLPTGMRKFLSAAYQLATINKSRNMDENGNVRRANWNDGSEKHYPWWRVLADKKNPSGSGLSLRDVDYDYSLALVASRLTTIDEEDTQFTVDNLQQLWEDLILDKED